MKELVVNVLALIGLLSVCSTATLGIHILKAVLKKR